MRCTGRQRSYGLALLLIGTLAGMSIALGNVMPVSASARQAAGTGARPAWLKCKPGSPGSGIADRCTGIHKIPVSQLSPADQARRRADLTRMASRSRSGEIQRKVPATPAVAGDPPSQCFAPAGVVASPDRFTSCGETAFELENILYGDDGTETVIGTFGFDDLQWVSFSGTNMTWTHALVTNTLTGTGDLAAGFDGEVASECSSVGTICAAVSATGPDPPDDRGRQR
jgi:hypothetical protein